MFNFRKLLSEGTKLEITKDYERTLFFAETNLSVKDNIHIYNSLSYLDRIPELNVRLATWDSLQCQKEFDEKAYKYTLDKIRELKSICERGVTL